MQWTLVIPLKALARAKSRLSDIADDGLRSGLALAFAQDTVGAALAGTGVYLWLTDRPTSPAPGTAALSAGPGGVSVHVLLP